MFMAAPLNVDVVVMMMITIPIFLAVVVVVQPYEEQQQLSCRSTCGRIAIKYPFGVDDGCGSPHFRGMLNCSLKDKDKDKDDIDIDIDIDDELFFLTPSGSYKVQRIDYPRRQLVVYDPSMSTCSILQPHHDLLLTDIQSALIPPSSDTVFALLNCSLDSPLLNHYTGLCFNFSGHSCDQLYSSCNAFRVFRLLTNSSSPPCCFTSYDTVRFMSMNILDCSHYTTVINTDGLRGIGPLDWVYGIKLSYAVPETGCARCSLSGGTCGFDTETLVSQCLCSHSTNATRECGGSSEMASDRATEQQVRPWTGLLVLGIFGLLL